MGNGTPHHYNPYKQLPQQQQNASTLSPVIRKRYQQGNLIAEDLQYRHLHGNTSPIVLQRFYHQQNQFRDQKEEESRALRVSSPPTGNPFRHHQSGIASGIPIKSGSPNLNNLRYIQHHQQQSPTPARPTGTGMYNYQRQQQYVHQQEPIYQQSYHQHQQQQHHQQQQPLPSQQQIYESHIPLLQSKHSNGNIQMHHHQQQQPLPQQQQLHHHQQQQYDPINRAPLQCPNSPQLDRLRANLEKPNFYERNQKLPIEVESSYGLDQSTISNSNGVNVDKNKDRGKLFASESSTALQSMLCNSYRPKSSIPNVFFSVFFFGKV